MKRTLVRFLLRLGIYFWTFLITGLICGPGFFIARQLNEWIWGRDAFLKVLRNKSWDHPADWIFAIVWIGVSLISLPAIIKFHKAGLVFLVSHYKSLAEAKG
jgi:hypothetical protein